MEPPPAMTITENMIYDACVELKMDPLQFRRDNLQRAGWENHYGQVMTEGDVTMTACLDEAVRLPQLEKAGRGVQPEQQVAQEGSLHHSKQVRNWNSQHVRPKRLPGAHLPRWLSADQPRRDRDGPGSPHQDAASGLHRTRG